MTTLTCGACRTPSAVGELPWPPDSLPPQELDGSTPQLGPPQVPARLLRLFCLKMRGHDSPRGGPSRPGKPAVGKSALKPRGNSRVTVAPATAAVRAPGLPGHGCPSPHSRLTPGPTSQVGSSPTTRPRLRSPRHSRQHGEYQALPSRGGFLFMFMARR